MQLMVQGTPQEFLAFHLHPVFILLVCVAGLPSAPYPLRLLLLLLLLLLL